MSIIFTVDANLCHEQVVAEYWPRIVLFTYYSIKTEQVQIVHYISYAQ